MNEKNRIYVFDLIKLLSIFCVFIYHIVMDVYVVHPMYNLKLIYTFIDRKNVHLAMISCTLFIIISGITITLNYKKIKIIDFYKKRLFKVLIPFYISYIIYFIIKVISLHNFRLFGGIERWRFIYTIMGLDEYLSSCGIKTYTLGVGEWFLGCIVMCYIAFPLIYKCFMTFRKLVFIIFTLYYIIIVMNYDSLNFVIPSHMNFICHIYNFFIGICIGDYIKLNNKKNNFNSQKMFISFILVILTFMIYIMNYKLMVPMNFIITILAIFIIISLYLIHNYVDCIIKKNIFINNIFTIFNKISLEIFLVHHFIIYQIDFMFNYRRLRGYEMLFIFIVDFILTILVSYIVNILSNIIIKKLILNKKALNNS